MNEEEFGRRMADLIEGPTPEKDAVLDALLERLIAGEHGRWTLKAIKALCLVRDQFRPLMDATWHTEGRDAVYAINGYMTLLEGVVDREIARLYPDVDSFDIMMAIGGPLDLKPDARAATFGPMFERAEKADAERIKNARIAWREKEGAAPVAMSDDDLPF